MIDVRKIIIIFLIAVLFAVLSFAIIEAFYPTPNYEDFCNFRAMQPRIATDKTCSEVNVTLEDQQKCNDAKGYIDYTNYDSNGCPISYECNTCQTSFNVAQEKHKQYVFYISALMALVAIFIGLYLPANKNMLNEWIGTGFMLGGAFILIFGTAMSFSALDRYVRVAAILIELILVIFISYKKIGNLKK